MNDFGGMDSQAPSVIKFVFIIMLILMVGYIESVSVVIQTICATAQSPEISQNLSDACPFSQLKARSKISGTYIDLDLYGNDPFGIRRISSFYGPGSWAAWLIALLCIFLRCSNLSYASYFFYTTFAWVDLLGRYNRVLNSDGGRLLENDMGSFAAAYDIVWVSSIFNGLLCMRAIYSRGHRQLRSWAEWAHLLLGMAPIPIVLAVVGSGMHAKRGGSGIFTTDSLDRFPLHMCVENGYGKTVLVDNVMSWAFLGVCQAFTYFFTIINRFKTSFLSLILLSLAGGCYFIGILAELVCSLALYFDCGVFTQSFVYLPYTSNSLLDMDQLFALSLGIFCACYEIGLVQVIRQALKRLNNWRKRFNNWRKRARAKRLLGLAPRYMDLQSPPPGFITQDPRNLQGTVTEDDLDVGWSTVVGAYSYEMDDIV